MTQRGQRGRLGAAAIAMALLGVGVAIGTAVADRSSTAPPIVYSGQLLGAAGTPVADGMFTIRLSLWSTPSGLSGNLCDNGDASVNVTGGRFSVTLLDTALAPCGRVFESEEEVYVELDVTGPGVPRTTIARANARASAVPYAVRAEHAAPAQYCGSTTPTAGIFMSGSLRGYAAARSLCQAECGGSATAHMCTAAEAAVAFQLGSLPAELRGWVTGTTSTSVRTNPDDMRECDGWRTVATTSYGAVWDTRAGSAGTQFDGCGNSLAILCCD